MAMVEQQARGLILAPHNHAYPAVQREITDALTEMGIEVRTLDAFAPDAGSTIDIINAIRGADFIVIDITRQDASTMYEVGYAHAFRKPMVLIIDVNSGSGIPGILHGVFVVPYDPNDLSNMVTWIKRSAAHLTERGAA